MALSSIALSSRALLKLGANPISGFEEGTAESQIAGTIYASTRDALISAYPWSFATAQRRLARLSASPTADYLQQQFLMSIPKQGQALPLT